MKLRDRGRLDWDEVFSLRDQGYSYRGIAERLGCDAASVYYAVNHVRIRRRRRRAYASPTPIRRPWTVEEALAAFEAFAEKKGYAPRMQDLGTHGLPWPKTVCRLFGTLSEAQRQAGLEPGSQGRRVRPTDHYERKAA
jgi:hypothetical protein